MVYDEVSPAITLNPYEPFCSFDTPTDTDPQCEGQVTISFRLEEMCTPNDITFEVYLDVFNNSSSSYDYEVRMFPDGSLSGDTAVFSISGTYPDYTLESAGLPIGAHQFEINAIDGCGNTISDNALLEVADCKAPIPICISGLGYALSPVDTDDDGIPDTGRATAWATDFISDPITDCTPPVTYSIRRQGQMPDIQRSSLIFECDDYNPADGATGTPHLIYIDAWDGAGNRAFCETFVRVQDPSGICSDTPLSSISGAIYTEQMEPVEGVDISLSGPVSLLASTPDSGTYLFPGLPTGFDYTITPVLDRDYLNGVTTFDLVMIQRHILTVQLLDSPYKLIAADANNSQTITTLDIIILRRLILTVINDLPNNTSWRFLPSSYAFPVPANPWLEPFPEMILLNDLVGAASGHDFIGVKIGDVNGSVVPN